MRKPNDPAASLHLRKEFQEPIGVSSQDGVAKEGGVRARLPLGPVMKTVNGEPFRTTQSLDLGPAR